MNYKSISFNILKLITVFCILNVSIYSAHAAKKPIICIQEYALCTSASCIPDARHSGYAICHCDVENGPSAGYESCAKRVPVKTKYNTEQIVSTFSLTQYGEKKSLVCAQGFWTNCVDSPCTVDPTNPKHAICNCPITTGAYTTLGGNCNIITCTTHYWSGASAAGSAALKNAMHDYVKTSKALDEHQNCPVN